MFLESKYFCFDGFAFLMGSWYQLKALDFVRVTLLSDLTGLPACAFPFP